MGLFYVLPLVKFINFRCRMCGMDFNSFISDKYNIYAIILDKFIREECKISAIHPDRFISDKRQIYTTRNNVRYKFYNLHLNKRISNRMKRRNNKKGLMTCDASDPSVFLFRRCESNEVYPMYDFRYLKSQDVL